MSELFVLNFNVLQCSLYSPAFMYIVNPIAIQLGARYWLTRFSADNNDEYAHICKSAWSMTNCIGILYFYGIAPMYKNILSIIFYLHSHPCFGCILLFKVSSNRWCYHTIAANETDYRSGGKTSDCGAILCKSKNYALNGVTKMWNAVLFQIFCYTRFYTVKWLFFTAL